MRILVRTSRWAVWARRLGSLALPLTALPILMHRSRAIPTETFEVVGILALAVIVLTLLCCAGAFTRIWITGDRGWGRAFAGLFFALVCLSPFGLLAYDYLRYPSSGDVSTDLVNPPPLQTASLFGTPVEVVSPEFANLKPRRYPLPVAQVFALVDKLVGERGWDVQRRHVPVDGGDASIAAVATTLLGFRSEVALRVAPDADGSILDMRSVSLSRFHESGANGVRVEDFLDTIDARITLLIKDQPAGSTDDSDAESDDTTEAAPVVPAPPPTRERKR